MSKGRVLYITVDDFPPKRVDLSELFGHELSKMGYEIDWLAQSETPSPSLSQQAWRGGTAFVGPKTQGRSIKAKLRNTWQSLSTDWQVFRLASRGYDVIQVRDKFIVALFALMAARWHRAQFTYWLSYPFPEAHQYRADNGYSRFPWLDRVRAKVFGFLLYKVIMPRADHNFVQSEQMKADIAAKGIALEKMTPVPMGVSLKNAPQKQDVVPGQLIYIGAMTRQRRIDFLLQVVAVLKTRQIDCHLQLVGSAENPKDIEFLKDLCVELDIESRVTFVGQLPIEETWQRVLASQIGLSPIAPNPMYRPASPTKLVEYMALETAVVANDHSEQKRVLDSSGAGLCTAFEVEPFAEAVAELLADPERCRAMGQKGRQWALVHRDYQQLARMLDPHYQALVQAAREKKGSRKGHASSQ